MSSRERKLLKKIKRYKKLNKILIKTKCKDCYELQRLIPSPVADYITFSNRKMDDSTFVYLTDKALESLENSRIGTLRFWVPTLISIIALLIALMSLVIDALQLISEFQKNIYS